MADFMDPKPKILYILHVPEHLSIPHEEINNVGPCSIQQSTLSCSRFLTVKNNFPNK